MTHNMQIRYTLKPDPLFGKMRGRTEVKWINFPTLMSEIKTIQISEPTHRAIKARASAKGEKISVYAEAVLAKHAGIKPTKKKP